MYLTGTRVPGPLEAPATKVPAGCLSADVPDGHPGPGPPGGTYHQGTCRVP
jgi:hypothetical protein